MPLDRSWSPTAKNILLCVSNCLNRNLDEYKLACMTSNSSHILGSYNEVHYLHHSPRHRWLCRFSKYPSHRMLGSWQIWCHQYLPEWQAIQRRRCTSSPSIASPRTQTYALLTTDRTSVSTLILPVLSRILVLCPSSSTTRSRFLPHWITGLNPPYHSRVARWVLGPQ